MPTTSAREKSLQLNLARAITPKVLADRKVALVYHQICLVVYVFHGGKLANVPTISACLSTPTTRSVPIPHQGLLALQRDTEKAKSARVIGQAVPDDHRLQKEALHLQAKPISLVAASGKRPANVVKVIRAIFGMARFVDIGNPAADVHLARNVKWPTSTSCTASLLLLLR